MPLNPWRNPENRPTATSIIGHVKNHQGKITPIVLANNIAPMITMNNPAQILDCSGRRLPFSHLSRTSLLKSSVMFDILYKENMRVPARQGLKGNRQLNFRLTDVKCR